MIEIAFNKNKTRHNKEATLLSLENVCLKTMLEYMAYAKEVILKYAEKHILYVPQVPVVLDVNKLALALFIQSCRFENLIDCVVFQTQNYEADLAAYKPYVALSIGIKYALRVAEEDAQTVYRELRSLTYLGFNIEEDYTTKMLTFQLKGEGRVQNIETSDFVENIAAVSALKVIALMKIKANIELKVHFALKTKVDQEALIYKIFAYVAPFINVEP